MRGRVRRERLGIAEDSERRFRNVNPEAPRPEEDDDILYSWDDFPEGSAPETSSGSGKRGMTSELAAKLKLQRSRVDSAGSVWESAWRLLGGRKSRKASWRRLSEPRGVRRRQGQGQG